MSRRSVHIGIFGLGTVGGGIIEILRRGTEKNKEYSFVLKRIVVRNLNKKRRISISPRILSSDPKAILDDPDIDTVVEVMGGIHPAQEIVLEALKKGKNVVTANKALLANVGSKIFEKALQNNCYLGIRASNIASYRLIESLTSSPSKIEELLGIFNGTCNYLLTEMERKGEDFPVILRRAQEIGYAEPDPSNDIRGYDTAHKLIILLGLALGYFIPLESLYVEGIERISYQDIIFTEELGYRIKLLALAKKVGNELEARVHPALLPRDRGLSRLEGIENGVEIKDEGGLSIRMQTPGAGKYPAAIAIMEDLICIAKGKKLFFPQETISLILKPMAKIQTKYYLRFTALDKAGVLAKISNVLGNHNISIEAVLQKGSREDDIKWVPIIMLTHRSREENIQNALRQIDNLSITKGNSLLIRVEEGIS